MIVLSSGRQVMVPNGSFSISRRLEIADYYSRNIFFLEPALPGEKKADKVANIHALTREEVIEISDAMISLWISLKDNVRTLGVDNPEIFNSRKSDK